MALSWGWFTGADKRNKQAMATAAENKSYITGGRDREQGFLTGGRDAAKGYLQPYEQQGRSGQTAYTNALGINGAEGRQSALGMYGQGFNPWLGDQVNRAQMLGDRRAAATGQFNSGMNALARARVGAEMGGQDWNNWIANLQGLGNQGFGAANTMAGNEMQYGVNMGNAERAATQGYVNNATQVGNALSSNYVSPMNYSLQLAQIAASAMKPGR